MDLLISINYYRFSISPSEQIGLHWMYLYEPNLPFPLGVVGGEGAVVITGGGVEPENNTNMYKRTYQLSRFRHPPT